MIGIIFDDNMKIFTGAQIRELDTYTIEHEPIRSIDLMERAAKAVPPPFRPFRGGNRSG